MLRAEEQLMSERSFREALRHLTRSHLMLIKKTAQRHAETILQHTFCRQRCVRYSVTTLIRQDLSRIQREHVSTSHTGRVWPKSRSLRLRLSLTTRSSRICRLRPMWWASTRPRRPVPWHSSARSTATLSELFRWATSPRNFAVVHMLRTQVTSQHSRSFRSRVLLRVSEE